ncbi:MAG: ribosome biogenesis GTP-binding protein YihA/YsxC [Bacteroidota bacterium]
MIIESAYYTGSFPTESKCPKDSLPEYAFIGRSNVGKSSLINMLCDRKGLAKVSGTPGKTQYLNFFLINKSWYIVDLPGYGYARISKTKRRAWEKMIQGYLNKRENLVCTFLLIDSNVKPQAIDLEFINWMGQMRIPFVLVFTKIDRKKKGLDISANIEAFKEALLESWEELPPLFESSANLQIGREEILNFIERTNEQVNNE